MHKVGTRVHTAHGDGEVTEVETVRGRTEYRVAGRGFNIYVEASKLQVASGNYLGGLQDTIDPGRPYEVNRDNSTTLPYDYTPQHHVDMFAGEQTIQPGEYEIDPDERLRSTDSLTGDKAKENRPYPGPNPDLFAKSARSEYDGPGPEDEPHYEQHSEDLAHEREQDEHAARGGGWPHTGAFEETDPSRPEWGDDEWHEGLPDGPERTFDASYRPAGLSSRYAHIMEAEDHTEIGMFRRDPVGYQQRLAHVMIAGEEDQLIEKFADYTNLLDSDEHMRTAAWKDVAAKAKRLRADGAVHPKDIGPNRILATVDGDNAQYQTLVLRGPGYAGIGKGANSATFSCTCQWGKWAFKRQFTFVGRMCSHALATLWELQSHSAKGNNGKFKSAGITDEFKSWADDNNDGHMDQGSIQDFLNTQDGDFTHEDVEKLYDYLDGHHQQVPERDYDIPYTLDNDKAYKTSDILRTRPQSLTPDLREVPQNDEHEWTDVTEDDRKTTGPDQIVHFSKIMAALHRTADDFQNGQDVTPTGGDGGLHNPFSGIGHWLEQRAQPNAWDRAHPQNANGEPVASPQGTKPSSTGWGVPMDDVENPFAEPPQSAGTAGDATHIPSEVGTGGEGTPAANPSEVGTGGESIPAPAATTTFPAPGPTSPAATPNSITPGTYHVQQGDTLSDIAQRAGLGKDNYQQIADANKDKISDPNHIETGWDIQVPGKPSSSSDATQAAGGTKPVDPGSPADMKTPQVGDDLTSAAGGTKPIAPSSPAAPDASTPPGSPGIGSNGLPFPQTLDSQMDNPPTGAAPTGLAKGGPPVGTGIDNTDYNKTPYHASNRRYAESSDANLLDKLRQLSKEPASDSLQHMDSRNDELRDVVDELNDRGLDASFMVASLHYADNPADGDANFFGKSYPNWADEPFQGSGPDPRHYISDSQSYLDDHEPDLHDVTDGDDIIKFNDSRSKPQQGPRHTSAYDGGGYYTDQGIHTESPGQMHFDSDGPHVTRNRPLRDPNFPGPSTREELHRVPGINPNQAKLPLDGIKPRGGPRKAVRVDPGVRGRRSQLRHADGTLPEPEGPNTVSSMEAPDPMAPSIDDNPGNDIVANFQRSAAAQDLWSGESSNSGGVFSDDAIAANAQSMLRTAGRKFTQQEQRELEEEAHILGARNLPNDDDLAGTHYIMGL